MADEGDKARISDLERRMEKAEAKVDKHENWISWITGIGMTVAAFIGFFASQVKDVLFGKAG